MNHITLARWERKATRDWDLKIGFLFKVRDGYYMNWDLEPLVALEYRDPNLKKIHGGNCHPLLYLGEDLFMSIPYMHKIRVYTPKYKWKNVFEEMRE